MAQQRAPLFTSANGLHKLCFSEINPRAPDDGELHYMPLPENSWSFTDLASAINIGLEIMETPPGKAALIRLGSRLVQHWGVQNDPCYRGGSRQMAGYVDHFLSATRRDFPNVGIRDLGSSDVLASSRRFGQGYGDLNNYAPKSSVVIEYNHRRVKDMISASKAVDELGRRRETSEGRAMRKKMLLQHKHFQFMFATATAHELCHAFYGYISQNGKHGRDDTPPEITHLDYGVHQQDDTDDPGAGKGESGRWVENILFGGSLEFYRDTSEDNAQTGVLHVLDSNEVAWKVHPKSILKFVEGARQYVFPLEISGPGISRQQRAQRGLRSLGSTAMSPYHPQVLFMRARFERHLPMYSVTREELNVVPDRPRIIRAVRVA